MSKTFKYATAGMFGAALGQAQAADFLLHADAAQRVVQQIAFANKK